MFDRKTIRCLSCLSFLFSSLSYAKGLSDLAWLTGKWDCKMKIRTKFQGKETIENSEGQFVAKPDLQGAWFEGRYLKNGEEITRSYYGYNNEAGYHIMYFIDKFGGHGEGLIKNQSGAEFKYEGTSYYQNYTATFFKNFIKVSDKQYNVKYETKNTKDSYISETEGICRKL